MSTEETGTAAPQGAADAAPKPRKQAKAKRAAEPRVRAATDVEFRFAGDPSVGMRGVPARDLTQADVDRMVYVATIPEPGASGLRRGDPGFSQARAKVARQLTAGGKFKKRS